jgi:hypothetical protein
LSERAQELIGGHVSTREVRLQLLDGRGTHQGEIVEDGDYIGRSGQF